MRHSHTGMLLTDTTAMPLSPSLSLFLSLSLYRSVSHHLWNGMLSLSLTHHLCSTVCMCVCVCLCVILCSTVCVCVCASCQLEHRERAEINQESFFSTSPNTGNGGRNLLSS